MKKYILFAAISMLLVSKGVSQVSINTDGTTPDSSSMLDVKSTDKGFLPPRMTTEQMNNIINPAQGLIIYNLSVNSLFWFDGSTWNRFNTSQWISNGNHLQYNTGHVGIGTSTPLSPAHISGTVFPALYIDAFGVSPELTFRRTNSGTPATISGDIIGGISGTGHDGTTLNPKGRAAVNFHAGSDWTTSNNETYLGFSLTKKDKITTSEQYRFTTSTFIMTGDTTLSDTFISTLFDNQGRIVQDATYNGRMNLFNYNGDGGVIAIYNIAPAFNNLVAGHYAMGALNDAGDGNTVGTWRAKVTNVAAASMSSELSFGFMDNVNTTGGYTQPNKRTSLSANGLTLPSIPLTGVTTLSAATVGIGTPTPTAKLHVDSDIIRIETPKTPASATAAGNTGDICWDANYIYICVATNTWKRSAISTW